MIVSFEVPDEVYAAAEAGVAQLVRTVERDGQPVEEPIHASVEEYLASAIATALQPWAPEPVEVEQLKRQIEQQIEELRRVEVRPVTELVKKPATEPAAK